MVHRNDLGNYLNSLGLTKTGVEVGVQDGFFASQILSQWRGERLYLVDVWRHWEQYRDWGDQSDEAHRKRLAGVIERMAPHWGRISVIQEASLRAARLFDDHSLDFVYIDASHDFTSAFLDLSVWWPKVRVGGMLAGHDYIDHEITHEGYTVKFEVKKAVDTMFQDVQSTQEQFPSWWLIK